MTPTRPIDIHQHLWPPALVDALRRRSTPPRLDGWTLHLSGEPPYQVDPVDHDRHGRAKDPSRVVVGLSSPLGIEDLPPDEAQPLLDAWHEGAADLTEFDAWAAVARRKPDLTALAEHLRDGFVGLQIPATALAGPTRLDGLGDLLEVVQNADRPVFVHPGPVPPAEDERPDWWAAVVDYPTQLQAAWWSWHAAGRRLFPRLRIQAGRGRPFPRVGRRPDRGGQRSTLRRTP
jgi:hypothetical protein